MQPTIKDTICDPAMGSAGFIVESAKYINEHYDKKLMKKDNAEHVLAEENIPESDDICTTNGWTLTNRAEWWDITVCAFDDDSFCFLEDLESWNCEKWFIFFGDKEASDTENEVEEVNVEDCETMAQEIVCGEDGNTYFNRCYLNAAWVAEETELAHVENWECIYG